MNIHLHLASEQEKETVMKWAEIYVIEDIWLAPAPPELLSLGDHGLHL